MKKFLSVVSLLLVAVMMLAMPTVSAAEDNTWVKPEGVNVWYANDVSEKAPEIDGEIKEGEYGKLTVKIEDPKPAPAYGTKWATDPVDPTLPSEYMDVYFAYDADNIYIAIYEMGPTFVDNGDEIADNDVVYRNNYTFKIGFDLNDVKKYFQFGGFQTHINWAELSYFDMGGESGSVKNNLPIGTYSFVEAVIAKTDVATGEIVAYGDLISANGNKHHTKGQWSMTIEMKISKSDYIQTINDVFGTEYNNVSGAMWMILDTQAYKKGAEGEKDMEQYFRCIGQNDVTGKQDNYIDYGVLEGSTRNSMPDVIVFGDENTAIKVASPEGDPIETEAPTTEAPAGDVTEAPAGDATEAPAGDDTPDTEPTKSGCGASVSVAGLALVAALGTCTVFVAKKKEN